MSNAFDGLGSSEPYVPNYLQDEIQFRIDNDLRTIAIPADGVVLGVVGDKNVNHVNFQMPAWYNGFNMSLFQARINFIDASGNANYYTVDDMTVLTPEGNEVVGVPGEDDIIYFTWLVDSYATGYVGQVKFNVRLTKFDTSTNPAVLSQAFNTQINSCQVLEGIQLADEITQEQAEDILFHYTAELGDITEGYKHDIEEKAAATLETIPEDYTELTSDITTLQNETGNIRKDVLTVLDDCIPLGPIIPNSYPHSEGTFEEYEGWNRTDYIAVSDMLTDITIVSSHASSDNAFYDESKELISRFSVSVGTSVIHKPIGTKFMVLSNSADDIANTKILKPVVKAYASFKMNNISGGFYDSNNVWNTDSTLNCTVTDIIKVTPGETYGYIGSAAYSVTSVIFFDVSGNKVSAAQYDSLTTATTVTVPGAAAYVKFQSYAYNVSNKAYLSIEKLSYNNGNENDIFNIRNVINMLQPLYTKIDLTYTDGGYYIYNRNLNNGLRSDVGFGYSVIDVYKGEQYVIRGSSMLDMQCAIVFDADGKRIKSYSGVRENLVTDTHVIDIEEDGSMAVCKINSQGNPLVLKRVGYTTTDKFKGKTILFTGDSICNGYGWDYNVSHSNRNMICLTNPPGGSYYNLGWAQVFAERHRDSHIYSYGINGSTVAIKDSIPCIMTRIGSMYSTADYVLLSGGINDCFKAIEVGTVSEGPTSLSDWHSVDDLDTSTFAGAVETMLFNAKTKWVNAKIGYIITQTVPTSYEDFKAYREVIKSACDKWGVPVLDLSADSSITYGIAAINSAYSMGDVVHPNERCYRELLADKIESFITAL